MFPKRNVHRFSSLMIKIMFTTKSTNKQLRSIEKYHCPEITAVNILVIYVTHIFITFYINGIKLLILFPNLLFQTYISDTLSSQ